MTDALRREGAGEKSQVAVHVETRGQRGEAVGKVRLIISAIVQELVDRGIDVAIGELIQSADHEMPVRTEIVLYPDFADLRRKIHAGERLPIACARRIRRIAGNRILFDPGVESGVVVGA